MWNISKLKPQINLYKIIEMIVTLNILKKYESFHIRFFDICKINIIMFGVYIIYFSFFPSWNILLGGAFKSFYFYIIKDKKNTLILINGIKI